MAITARGRTGATHNITGKTTAAASASENCVPAASATDNPSSRIRREFHRMTSRGAYNVCATAMPVKTMPNAPQTPLISPKLSVPAVPRIIPGEKQYSVSAMYPPAFP